MRDRVTFDKLRKTVGDTRRSKLRKYAIIMLLLSVQATAGAYQAPLNATEKALAMALIQDTVLDAAASNPFSRNFHSGLASLEWLSIAVKKTKNKNELARQSRHADVFLYDYRIEKSLYGVVDLQSQQLLEIRALPNHHLPLNSQERSAALTLVWSNKAVVDLISTELTSLDSGLSINTGNLRAKVAVFQPHHTLSEEEQICQQRRCARINFTTPTQLSLSIEPIVLLATGEVFVRAGNL